MSHNRSDYWLLACIFFCLLLTTAQVDALDDCATTPCRYATVWISTDDGCLECRDDDCWICAPLGVGGGGCLKQRLSYPGYNCWPTTAKAWTRKLVDCYYLCNGQKDGEAWSSKSSATEYKKSAYDEYRCQVLVEE